jgi:L-rhamnose mutarotase
MERRAFFIYIYPGKEAEYDTRHDEIWPEMERALTASGFTNYSLFRSGTTILGYVECVPTIAEANLAMGKTDVVKKWNVHMSDVIDMVKMQSAPVLEEVWHLNENR